MAYVTPPPLNEAVVDQTGVPTIPWTLFFNGIFTGDTGNDWTPHFVGLTSTGTPVITGRYYRISRNLVYFRITVTPETNTSAEAGVTYIDNFPLQLIADSACFAVAGGTGSNAGHVIADSARIYVPKWENVTIPVTITGTVEAK